MYDYYTSANIKYVILSTHQEQEQCGLRKAPGASEEAGDRSSPPGLDYPADDGHVLLRKLVLIKNLQTKW